MDNSDYDAVEPIAIIGMAGRFPKAGNLDEFWENLRNGKESVTFFTDEELTASGVEPDMLNRPNYVKAAMVLDDIGMFDASFFGFSPREAELMDPQHRVFLECAWEALENAGWDPEQYGGRIGVYAGVGINTYLLRNLMSHPEFAKSENAYQIGIGNDKDFVPTRVSYKLNLKGPSVNVNTACSSSLVAIQFACQSLMDYQNDMALAGGVSIQVPNKTGYLYQEGGIPSPDGHCRAFDAKAKGTVVSSGVGIVLLKRLEDALEDGDHVHAVIKGSAINNDGSLKVGYTAPSAQGQALVIAEAQELAGVNPGTITYIEAHGTGTTLGDPIELDALTQVFRFRTQKKGFCAIGSVKTNMGHADTAAGVAGLIKTVLALKHQTIPPSLNFERPNPNIDFENSPFYVNAELAEWKTPGNMPRRAGVSSFGIGGTNAHVVLEEFQGQEARGEGQGAGGRPFHLIALSAKTDTALERMSENLADHLNQHPDLNLADAAYTLQVGRKSFDHRQMLVCQDIGEAEAALRTRDPKQILTSFRETQGHPQVVFMFSGQGAQYVNMGLELYHTEPIFREEIDRCSEQLISLMGLDLRQILYPSGARGEGQGARGGADITSTAMAQPALFVIEYALAKLWMAWGIQPQAMIGHSIGEYVAACLAQVFSLEDALALVAARARMMAALPGGAMMAVPLPEKEVTPLLGGNLSLAAVNTPCLCVISGQTEAVRTLQEKLSQQGVECRPLHTSHAFHSKMMDSVVPLFTEQVRQVRLNPPQTPYISNVTGTWMTAKDATSPAYWAKHLRQTVRFADGIRAVVEDSEQLFLEVGPGRTLATFATRHPDKKAEHLVLSSVRHPRDPQPDGAFLTATLGRLWLAGGNVDWSAYHAHEKRHRMPLPTYAFERQNYWVEPRKWEVGSEKWEVGSEDSKPASKKTDIADWFHVPSWKRCPLPVPDFQIPDSKSWLVFLDECGLGDQLVLELKRKEQDVSTVKLGPGFAKLNHRAYVLNPGQYGDYDLLFGELREENKIPNAIVHLWNVTSEGHVRSGLEGLGQTADTGFSSLIFLAQSLVKQHVTDKLRVTVISDHMQDVTGDENLCPEKAALLGPVRVIPQEYPNISCRCIDVLVPESGSDMRQQLTDNILAELASDTSDPVIAFRGPHRWVQTFEPVRLERGTKDVRTEHPQSIARLREKGVYLITGGLGGIGGELAKHLARTVQAKLVLTGRTRLPERELWKKWLSPDEDSDNVIHDFCAKIVRKKIGLPVNMADEADDICQQEHALRTALGIPEIKDHEGLEQTLNDLCASHVFDYFRTGNIRTEKGRTYKIADLKRQLDILPQFEKFYDFFIRVLSEDSIIRVTNGNAEFLKGEPDVRSPESLKAAAERKYPDFAGMFGLLSHCARHYHEALSGETQAIGVLYPDGSADLLRGFGETTVEHGSHTLFKALLKDVISSILAKAPHRNVRILEVGAGNGTLTEVILPVLTGRNVEYHFTDIGKAFVVRAERKAAGQGHRFMKFGVLDISADPVPQGYEACSFDLILGMDVVHATRSVRETLGHLTKLLVPNGVIALIETVKEQRWVDMVWGLAEGWWYFEDEDIRKDSPLLGPDAWETVFQNQGLVNVRAYPRDGKKRSDTDCGLIIGQRRDAFDKTDRPDRIAEEITKEKKSIQRKIGMLKQMESLGGEVLPLCADVSDLDQMRDVIHHADECFGKIHGVIHSAGLEHGGAIQLMTPDLIRLELGARVRGTLVLEALFQDVRLDFFALCSSLHAISGGFGLSGYCGACSFIDAFATLMNAPKRRVVSINWERWKNTGRAVGFEKKYKAMTGEDLPGGMSSEEGVETFCRIVFGSTLPQVLISTQDMAETLQDPLMLSSLGAVSHSDRSEPAHSRPDMAVAYIAPESEVEHTLADIWQNLLGIGQVGIHDNFFELGGDSLLGVQVISRIRDAFGVELTPATLFERPTVAGLAESIMDKGIEEGDEEEMARLLEELEQMSEEEVRKKLGT